MFLQSSKPFTILLFLTVTLVSVNKVTGTGEILDVSKCNFNKKKKKKIKKNLCSFCWDSLIIRQKKMISKMAH